MIRPIAINAVDKVECKKFQAKSMPSHEFALPEAKNLKSASKDQFIKQGPTCGIDCCAI